MDKGESLVSEKAVPFVFWECIEKIEFHEVKIPQNLFAGIETRFYIKGEPNRLHEFLKWCDGADWDKNRKEDEYNYECKRAMRSSRENVHFRMFIHGKFVEIFPKQNYVVFYEIGLHYICQHCFDILPQEAKGIFYNHKSKDAIIGNLYPKPKKYQTVEPLIVKVGDIVDGFHLFSEQVDSFRNSFVIWVKHRREEEQKNGNTV
jgi:hypothetical protein